MEDIELLSDHPLSVVAFHVHSYKIRPSEDLTNVGVERLELSKEFAELVRQAALSVKDMSDPRAAEVRAELCDRLHPVKNDLERLGLFIPETDP